MACGSGSMLLVCHSNLTLAARPASFAPHTPSRPRLLCRAAAAQAAELATAPKSARLLVRLAQPEDARHVVQLTRELAQVPTTSCMLAVRSFTSSKLHTRALPTDVSSRQETEALDLPFAQVTAGVKTLISDPSKGRAFVVEVQWTASGTLIS